MSGWSEAAVAVAEQARGMVSSGVRVHWRQATSSWAVGSRRCSPKGILHDQQGFQSQARQSYLLEHHILAQAARCGFGKPVWDSRKLQIQSVPDHRSASLKVEGPVYSGVSAAAAVAAVVDVAVEASAVVTYLSWNLASTCYPKQRVKRRNRCCLASWSETMELGGSWVRQHLSVVEAAVAVPGQAQPWERYSSLIDETGDVGS